MYLLADHVVWNLDGSYLQEMPFSGNDEEGMRMYQVEVMRFDKCICAEACCYMKR